MTAVLTDAEAHAVDVAYAVYRAVSGSPALDGTDHWDRFANRIRSAATAAPTAMRFVEQCGRRFSVPHLNGDAIRGFLAAPAEQQAAVLRVLRHESTPVSVLVRARRDESREKLMSLVLPDRHERIESTLTATSPLIHSDERVEVMQRFRREPFLIDGELRDIPVYSGNAIRGMLRRASALRLCDLLGVQDRELPLPVFYLLFSGGYLEGGDHSHRTEELESFRSMLPMIALYGGSWESRILHGLLDVDRGVPVCAELAGTAGHDYPAEGLTSVYDLLTEQSYARRDDRPPQADGSRHVQQMRYTFEALIPGARLLHGFTLRTADQLVRGCLADAILTCTRWQSLGGRSAIGHGRFTWTAAEWAEAERADVDAYRDHVAGSRAEIRTLLGIGDQQTLAA